MGQNLQIEYLGTHVVRPSANNARTHSRKQLHQIAQSIEAFGFTNPVLIDEDAVLIAGHGRLEAARSLGLESIPAIRIEGLSATKRRALMLADNKIALDAGWDPDILAAELADLSSMRLDFDLEVTGFDIAEIDLVIGDTGENRRDATEMSPEPNSEAIPISQTGDVWDLGPHRLYCGDARDPAAYAKLMDTAVADAVFTDPPYNVAINGHVSGKGRVRHREFAHASGEMSEAEYQKFLHQTLGLAAQHCRDGAVAFSCIDWRHATLMETAGLRSFGTVLNLCVWAKTNAGMGSLYRSQHELVFVFRKGATPHCNNVQLGRYGRHRSNVWTYPGVNTFHKGRDEELTNHPTPKPVAMVRDALLDVTRRGDIVLDSFMGAGATLIAAERCGRAARGIEIDPLYVDVILRRWRQETGEEPVRTSDGMTLAELESVPEREEAL